MIARIQTQLKSFAGRWWYLPLVTFLSAADAFVVVVPIEALLIPAVLSHPRRWVAISFWVTLGSTVGAVAFAALAGYYGEGFVESLLPGALHSKTWQHFVAVLNDSSTWGLGLISLSPFPQHAAVAIVGLAKVPLQTVFVGVFCGRLVKYLFVSWACTHAPRILRKLHVLPPLPKSPEAQALKLAYPSEGEDGERIQVAYSFDDEFLIVRFEVHTRELTPERVPEARLWEGNVVELFLSVTGGLGQPHWPYFEFEVSPYGQKCLVLVNGEGAANRDFGWNLKGFTHSSRFLAERPGWEAEMRIPLKELGWEGDFAKLWVNAFAILGPDEANRRFYGLNLPQQDKPNFHLPGQFVPLLT